MKYDIYDTEPEDADESTQESIQRKQGAQSQSDKTQESLRLLGAGKEYGDK